MSRVRPCWPLPSSLIRCERRACRGWGCWSTRLPVCLIRVIHGVFGAVLSVMMFAVLAGARNFQEIADRGADLPVECWL